jgi:hypothetical protein
LRFEGELPYRWRHKAGEQNVRVAYKDMHTLYEAEQKRADRLSRDEASKELKNGENSDWVTKQLKKAWTPRTGTPSKSSSQLLQTLRER